jgi:hypothetical protein
MGKGMKQLFPDRCHNLSMMLEGKFSDRAIAHQCAHTALADMGSARLIWLAFITPIRYRWHAMLYELQQLQMEREKAKATPHMDDLDREYQATFGGQR